MADDLKQSALRYHREPVPGKISISPTKPLANQRDLALAYSPGVAAASSEIADDPAKAVEYTARGNLVAVISNGTAVLGLGAIGALASKPVMEGKGVLFKKFAGIDVFDIEVDASDPDKFVEVVAALEPTFGAINLEDIKAPECFVIERALRERMSIPVFHDDQHGTAIVVSAAAINGLRVVEKDIADVRMVSTGGGAAGLACLNLMLAMGLKRENVTLVDQYGVIYEGREVGMDEHRAAFAQKTDARTLDDVIDGADVFLGLSAPDILTADMVKRMAERPLILALANPDPEIDPNVAREARPDAVIATGRSDFPNQVNNVLCFPFIFRGALDVGATEINEEMKLACVRAVADLAMAESSDVVAAAYGEQNLAFGPENLIPKPFDPRLILAISPAVAEAAMKSGVATRPIEDMDAYRERLNQFVYRSGQLMRSVFTRAREEPMRIAFCEGADARVLRASQIVVNEGIARPVLIARPDALEAAMQGLGISLKQGEHFDLVDPDNLADGAGLSEEYHRIMERKGASPDAARAAVRSDRTVLGALLLKRGEVDSMISGTYGQYFNHLTPVMDVIGKAAGVDEVSALSAMILPRGTVFICDTHVSPDPDVDEICEMTHLAAEQVQSFGIAPKVALLSYSNFGTRDGPSPRKMREAFERIRDADPNLEIEGEMHADSAMDPDLRTRLFPHSLLEGEANLLVMPNLDAANIAFNLLKSVSDAIPVGPILLGAAEPAHIVSASITARGLVNMAAFAVVDAQARRDRSLFSAAAQ